MRHFLEVFVIAVHIGLGSDRNFDVIAVGTVALQPADLERTLRQAIRFVRMLRIRVGAVNDDRSVIGKNTTDVVDQIVLGGRGNLTQLVNVDQQVFISRRFRPQDRLIAISKSFLLAFRPHQSQGRISIPTRPTRDFIRRFANRCDRNVGSIRDHLLLGAFEGSRLISIRFGFTADGVRVIERDNIPHHIF